MSKIDPEVMEIIEKGGGIETRSNNQGQIVGYKGPWLPDWYDNYMECLRENQFEKRRMDNKKQGKNFQGQTPEQEKNFNARIEKSKKIKDKAELATEMMNQTK